MKVLSGHGVSKSLTQSNMDPISLPATAVPLNTGLSLSQQAQANLASISHTGNINQKRWKSVMRRVQKKNKEQPKNALFGRALSEICQKDGSPPKAIMDILTLLMKEGLYTEGVFRRAGSAKNLKEIKAQLNDGIQVNLKEKSVIWLADLVKDFLRHLPGGLLMAEKCEDWMRAMEKEGDDQKCAEIQTVISTLPEPNIQLLKHFIVLLYFISENADRNKMVSTNLATCVSPNLLKTDNMERMEEVTNLTTFLIDNCQQIFGEDALVLYGDSDEDELSDNQDSFSSHHHDSAYDSNDPDGDAYKGSFSDMDSIKSGVEEKAQEHSSTEEPWTTKLLIRRRSEPTFNFTKTVQQRLSSSQTEMEFHEKMLTKQISDDCIVLRAGNSFGKGCCLARTTSRGCSYCSSSSLESCFSSASESSIHGSPLLVPSCKKNLQRKHSSPIPNRSETPRKRSQSMKSAHLRSRTVFGRSGSTKRAIERTLRDSQTLPEVLNPQPESRRLSSEEVFQQVDSKIPSNPPTYEQAIHDNSHVALSSRKSLTVQDARCLSKQTCSSSRSSSEETLDESSGNEHADIHNRDNTEPSCDSMSGSSSDLRRRTSSETMYVDSLTAWSSQEHLRESYV